MQKAGFLLTRLICCTAHVQFFFTDINDINMIREEGSFLNRCFILKVFRPLTSFPMFQTDTSEQNSVDQG